MLTAAVELIAERGPAAVSLRDLARRAGVSHAAPAHHFGDKAGLFTAIAVQGHEILRQALAGGADLAELGVRYVRFAAEYRSHFEVMFRPDLCHRPRLRHLHGSGSLDALLAEADPFEAFREAALLLSVGR